MDSCNDIPSRLIRVAELILSKKEPPVGMPDDCILHDKSRFTKVHKNGRGRWRDKDGFLYEWDALHGEIEVYNARGKYVDVWDKNGKEKAKGAEKGRRIDVR